MDTKHFALQHWVDTDLLVLRRISTHDNESDAMTKNVGITLFYRHTDYFMGRIIPDYAMKHSDLTLYDQAFKVSPIRDRHKAGEGSIT